MTSKEKLDFMYGVAIYGSSGSGETADTVRECYNAIADDLEELEELKELMGTPIQEIMKKLKVLKILKENANLYVSEINKKVKYIEISISTNDNRFDKVNEWLNEK